MRKLCAINCCIFRYHQSSLLAEVSGNRSLLCQQVQKITSMGLWLVNFDPPSQSLSQSHSQPPNQSPTHSPTHPVTHPSARQLNCSMTVSSYPLTPPPLPKRCTQPELPSWGPARHIYSNVLCVSCLLGKCRAICSSLLSWLVQENSNRPETWGDKVLTK